MASQQQQRRDSTTHEREMHVEKDIVPKRANKFEELAKATDHAATTAAAGSAKGSTVVAVGVTHADRGGGGVQKQEGEAVKKTDFEFVHDKMGRLQVGGVRSESENKEQYEKAGHGEAKGRSGEGFEDRTQQHRRRGEYGEEKQQMPSQAAHLVVAEERSAQSKQHGTDFETAGEQQGVRTEHQTKAEHHAGQQQMPSLEGVAQYAQTAQKESLETVRAVEERYVKAKEEAAKAAYAAKESAKQVVGAAASKAHEGVGATTQYLSEKTVPFASDYAMQAKDTTVSTTKTVAGYVGDKAAVAKDVAIETGKTATGYAGKVAEGVKDQAVVAGWGVAHKTTEIAVEATKMAGGVVVRAKDAVASAASKAAELAEVPVVMARDNAVETGEKLADYTAKKKIEAERYKEEKQSQYSPEGAHPTLGEGIGQKIQETTESIKDTGREIMDGSNQRMTEAGMMEESGSGVLEAIGETIVEIAQHTTNLVAGPGKQSQFGEKKSP